LKWLKHDTNASTDAKLKRVRMKYGMQGYGLYWYCLELIGANVDKHNLTFELEHDAEIIAHDTGINYQLVQEMMTFMVNLGLFEEKSGVITCLKMLKRIDQSMTSDAEMRKLLSEAKQNHDAVMTISGSNQPTINDISCKNRIEQNRTDSAKAAQIDANQFDAFWSLYPNKKDKQKARRKFASLSDYHQRQAIADVSARAKNDMEWLKDGGKFVPLPTTYLNGSRWEDVWRKSKPDNNRLGIDYV